MSTIRFPQRNLAPDSNNWARAIEQSLQKLTQMLREQQQATKQASSNAGWAIDASADLGGQLWLTRDEIRRQESKIEEVEADLAAEGPPMYWETYRPDEAPGEGSGTTTFVPTNQDTIWYVIDNQGKILEVWRYESAYDPILEMDVGEWVQERFDWDSLSEDVQEVIEEVELDIAAINQYNSNVVDPFIQQTNTVLDTDLPAAQQAAQDAQADALAALGKANNAVTLVKTEYALSTSRTVAPTTGWTTSTVVPGVNQIVWWRTKITRGNNITTTTAPEPLTGPDGPAGPTGPTGPAGGPGDPGRSVVSITPYYWLSDTPIPNGPPPIPTQNPPPAGWTTTQPEFTENGVLYRTELVVYSDNTFAYTPVTEVSSWDAANSAIRVANLAYQQANGQIWIGPNEPPLEARVDGQVWIRTDYEGRMVGIDVLQDPLIVPPVWQPYSMITGLLIVPGEDGIPTIIDQTGLTVGTISADTIGTRELMAESVGARELIIGEISQEFLDEDLNDFVGDTKELANRVVIGPSDITISQSVVGSQNDMTSMRLSATRLQFVVGNKPTAHIDSTRNQLWVGNAFIEGTLQVGEHQVKTLDDSHVTIFAWNNPIGG